MIDLSIGIAGGALALVGPVIPIMYPSLSKRWAYGIGIAGAALLVIAVVVAFLPAPTSRAAPEIVAPNNHGVVTDHQSGGRNTTGP
jgi:hypothetical protein